MRSIRLVQHLRLALACAAIVALFAFARVHAAPPSSGAAGGAIGGDWQAVDVPSLAGQRITALLSDGRGAVWVGAEERGLTLLSGEKWRSVGPRNGLPDSRVVAIFQDRQDRLWISTGNGLGYLPADGGPFRRIGLNGLRSLPILAFAQAPDGAILLGGAKGLHVWQADGALQSVPEFDKLAVPALHVDSEGVMWAGTSAGLWRSVDGHWEHDPVAGSGRVAAIAESPDGQLYAAAESGLWKAGEGTWRRLQAPVSGEMTALAARDGSVWLGTSQGIAAAQENVWETYDPALLPGARVTAMVWDGSGVLWVGTTGGLVAYQPDSTPPHIEIASINGQHPGRSAVRLGSDRLDRIAIAVSDRLTPQNRIRVFTRLDGVDLVPRLLTKAESANLQSVSVYSGQILAPGTYVLRAWGQDDAFNRSPEAQVSIVVPQLARVPGGLVIRQDIAYAGLAGLALVLTAGATTGAASRTRRRQAQHAAEAAAARVRAVGDRSAELYSAPVLLRAEQVRESVAALKKQHVLLLGERGMGKTVTLAAIAEALPATSDRSAVIAPAGLDLETVGEDSFFYALMRAAADALHPLVVGSRPRLRWAEALAPNYGEGEFSADLALLLARLQPQLGRQVVVVFLLDNADVLDRYPGSRRDAFRRLMLATSAASSPARLVLAAPAMPRTLGGFADLFHTVVLTPLSTAAATQLLRSGTQGLLEWEPDAEQAAVERAGGKPAVLSALGRAAAQAALSGNRLRITSSDVP